MNFQNINASASPEVQINENFQTIEFASVYGKRQPVTSGLTWGYYGGIWGGFSITAGTLALTDNEDNYISVERATGVISIEVGVGSPSTPAHWSNTSTYARVYKITTSAGFVTNVDDYRAGPNGVMTASTTGAAGTVTHSAGALTANSVMLGAGTDDSKVVAGLTSDGTSKIILGVAGSSIGSVDFKNGTSGTINLAPVTGALGSRAILLPAASGTIALTSDIGTAGALASDIDGTLAANSDLRIPTQKAVKTYADSLITANDAMVFKGSTDCSANPNYPAANTGDTYRVSVAGKIGGASGVNVEVGDLFICLADGTSSGNQATVGTSWTVAQANLDGAVIGPASATSGHIAVFSGTSGKLIADGGAVPAGTVTATAGALTLNALVLGAGTTDEKVVAGLTTDGTSKIVLGVAGSSVGSLDFKNATSGTINIAAVTGALGARTILLPAASGTFALTSDITGTNSGTNTGDQTITLTGDVTGSGTSSFAATIANDAVTYAKMQNVSATSRILGRKTAAAGDTEECTLSEILDFVGSAAQGDILYRNATVWVRLAAGTAGQFLKTLGAGANPAWTSEPYDVGGACAGVPAASLVIVRYPTPRAVVFPASLTSSQGAAAVAATAQTDFDILKNGVSFGTMRFAAAGTVATFISAAGATFAAGDVLTIVSPASPDATLADIGFSLAGTR